MKKALFTLFAASLLMAAACEKDGGKTAFPDPATKDVAVSIAFDKGEILKMNLPERAKASYPGSAKPDAYIPVEITAIDLSEGSRYVLYIDNIATVWTGKYSFEEGTYKMEGFGNLRIKDNALCLIDPVSTRAGEEAEYAVAATVKPISTATEEYSFLSRSWSVESTFMKLKGGKDNISITKGFNGCDLYEIGSFLKSKGISMSADDIAKLRGHKVSELYFMGNGIVVINFEESDPYYGTWKMNKGSFSWNLSDSNQLISAKADGSVSFENKKANLSVNANVSTSDGNYTGLLSLVLSPIIK